MSIELPRLAPAYRPSGPPMAQETSDNEKVVAQNRRARHDYTILDTIEAGLVLKGVEVKSLRTGRASLAEAYATVEGNQAYILQLHIPPYEQGNRSNQDPVRTRKLLMHRREIDRLAEAVEQKGQTLIPLKLYFSKGKAKVLIGIAKGKKQYDKRHAMAERDAQREIARARRATERDR
jgi:SsrA-binding protein